MSTKSKFIAASALVALLLAAPAGAQIVGYSTVSINTDTLTAVAEGYSVQNSVLRQPVYNDDDQRIGTINDLIIDPAGSASLVIIGTGRFIGSARHDVAIHVGHLTSRNGRFVLEGASKEAIRALPAFNYPDQPDTNPSSEPEMPAGELTD